MAMRDYAIYPRSCNIIAFDLAAHLQSLSYRSKFGTVCLYVCLYIYGNCLNDLFAVVPIVFEFKRSMRLASRSDQSPVNLDRCSGKFYANRSFSSNSHL